MTDSASDFEAKARAMYAGARTYLHDTTDRWIELMITDVVIATPGPGNQQPDDTEYQATGRLRGGYTMGSTDTRDVEASRSDGGPYEDRGGDTVAAAMSYVREQGNNWRAFYFTNDVAYGSIVMEGRGRHEAVGPRYWIAPIARESDGYLARAKAESAGGGV